MGMSPQIIPKPNSFPAVKQLKGKRKLRKETRNRKRVKTRIKQLKRNPSSPRTKVLKVTITVPIMGKIHTHDTANCFTLKNKAKADEEETSWQRHLATKDSRKEINLLAQNSSKAKVLDLYATVIAQEKAKLHKKSKDQMHMDTDSDSSHDMAYVEYNSDNKRKDSEVSPGGTRLLSPVE